MAGKGGKKEEYVFRGIRAMRIHTDDQIPFKYSAQKKTKATDTSL